jgi:TonB family protein
MPPISKETDTLTATPESQARPGKTPALSGDSGVKQQPVALEVEVSVNGARTVDGSAKREPFSETTKTVLVHGNGAVIRLTSSVAPGQLLFLTNERTKKEVVCQVVKSKNYRNVSGYVELEFTEPAVGFWGMRFPGDRIGSAPQAAPVAIPPAATSGSTVPPRPVAPKTEAPAVSSAPSVLSPKPAAPVGRIPSAGASGGSSIVPPPIDSASLLSSAKPKRNEAPAPVVPLATPPVPVAPLVSAVPELRAKPVAQESTAPTSPVFELSRASDVQASIFASTPQTLQAPVNLDLSSLAPFFEVKPPKDAVALPPPPPAAAQDPEMEELKKHTARLQEQLSSMAFAEPDSEATARAKAKQQVTAVPFVELAAPLVKAEHTHERAAEILETPKSPVPLPSVAEPVEPVNSAPAAPSSSFEALDQEELKIPAWLEPLARNASAPSSTQELVLREKAKRLAEQSETEEAEEIVEEAALPVQKEAASEPRMPEFGGLLPIDVASSPAESKSKGSGKGMLFAAIAAGVLAVAGGGWWYMNQQSAGVQAGAGTGAAPVAAASVLGQSPSQPQRETAMQANSPAPVEPAAASHTAPAQTNSVAESNPAIKSSSSVPAGSSAPQSRNSQISPNSPNGGKVVTSASAAQPEPVPAEVKKPVLGEVRLAAPKVSQNRKAQNVSEADAGNLLNDGESESNADSLGTGMVAGNKEPSAPAAPLPVGGEVKQARLTSKVDPVYPALAKNQHISGNVTIDALIDATGRVTTMKIVSGPTLLHQAAMDALKQWKYQPAMLDGKAVPMHLTVTLQFRLQ